MDDSGIPYLLEFCKPPLPTSSEMLLASCCRYKVIDYGLADFGEHLGLRLRS